MAQGATLCYSVAVHGVGVIEFGGPEALEILVLDEAHPGPGEVRLRVHAAAVNPADTYLRAGLQQVGGRDDPPPYVPGMDVAGVIDEVGAGVDGFEVGEAVMAMLMPKGAVGAYRQSLVLPANSVALSPAGASHAEASTLPMNGLTARLSLDELALEPGQTIAVTGAAGCYGGYVVQLAKADGLRVVADAAPADEELIRELGADIIVPRGDAVGVAIRAAVQEGADGLADGSVQNEQAVDGVRDGGGYASVRGWKGNGERGVTFHRTFVNRYDHRGDLLDTLGRQVEAGLIALRVAATFDATRAHEAHRQFEAGGTRGRCVIEF
jgi:NADPH2:quinone reductase